MDYIDHYYDEGEPEAYCGYPLPDPIAELRAMARRRADGLESLARWELELADLEPLLELFPYPAEPAFLRREG